MEATDVAPSASPLKLLLRPSILIVMCDVRKDGDWTELDITEPMALIIWGEHIPSVIPWRYANECRGDRSPLHFRWWIGPGVTRQLSTKRNALSYVVKHTTRRLFLQQTGVYLMPGEESVAVDFEPVCRLLEDFKS